jgi:hypothetical protein
MAEIYCQPPSTRGLGRLRKQLGPRISMLVHSALAADPQFVRHVVRKDTA